MEKIPTVSRTEDAGLQERVDSAIKVVNQKTKRAVRSLISYGGLILSMFVVAAFIIAMTTHIQSIPPEDFWEYASDIVMTWLLYVICASVTYISCSDSGMRAAKELASYISSQERYANLRQYVVDHNLHGYAYSYCEELCSEELKMQRTAILANYGISYNSFVSLYEGEDTKTLQQKYPNLSKLQLKCIARANATKRLNLRPEMLLRKSTRGNHRGLLGTAPEVKRRIHTMISITRITIVSGIMAFLMFEMIMEPTWATFAEAIIKAGVIIAQGFLGYKYGYDLIAISSTEYATDQADLIQQLIQYSERLAGEEQNEPAVYGSDQQQEPGRLAPTDPSVDSQRTGPEHAGALSP